MNEMNKTLLCALITVCVFGGGLKSEANASITGEHAGTYKIEGTNLTKDIQNPAFTARTRLIFHPQNFENRFFEIQAPDQNIVFEEVITNTGSHYSPLTGIFIAPSAGQYFFTATAQDVAQRGGTTLHIAHNGRIVAQVSAVMSSNPGQEPQGCSSVVLLLAAWDEVAVKSYSAGGKLIGSFSGFQI